MWAALCGLIASGIRAELDWTMIGFTAVGALLSGPLLGGIGALALSLGDMLELRCRETSHPVAEQRFSLPYTHPNSSSARLSQTGSQILLGWAQRMRFPARQYAVCMAISVAVAVSVAALIGGRVLALVAAGLAWSLALGVRGQSQRAGRHWLLFGSQITLGWLLGQVIVRGVEPLTYALSATLGATYWAVLSARGPARRLRLNLSYGFQVLGSLLLILARAPAAAGAVLLTVVAQLLFYTFDAEDEAYAKRIQPLITMQVLIVSIAVGGLR